MSSPAALAAASATRRGGVASRLMLQPPRPMLVRPTQRPTRQSRVIAPTGLGRRMVATSHPRRNAEGNGVPNPLENALSSRRRSGQSLPSKMIEAASTTFASIVVLGAGFALAGYLYHKFYKSLVLRKMHLAFEPGDPVLELAALGKDVPNPPSADHWVSRPEQARVDAIVDGTESGHYYLLIGEKGTGKSSMLLEAMKRIEGDGVAMCEAHADLEIFRIRLGKALNYEYHEDYIGGYFSERGPRESSSALLDIERALNKLEKVALNRRRERESGKIPPGSTGPRKGPIVLIINQMHLIRDDEDGRDLIELLQQRAEQWAAAGLVTMVFNSDDFWVYERLKQLATRMEVLAVGDLARGPALDALRRYRARYFGEEPSEVGDAILDQVYERVGGRLAFLNRVARSKDMLGMCDAICEVEKRWFLNQCWILGEEMDDDVMDQQKWASAAMVLAHHLVNLEKSSETLPYDPCIGHQLPNVYMHTAQQVMTRADFIRQLDRLNIFTITPDSLVRASSVPMQRAFREICSEPGFEEHLEKTLKRIADIESLGRTRELVAKDLVGGASYEIEKGIQPRSRGSGLWSGRGKEGVTVRLRPAPEGDDGNNRNGDKA